MLKTILLNLALSNSCIPKLHEMKTILFFLLLLGNYETYAQNSSYEKAWKALNENKRTEAEAILQQAMKEPATAADAYITNLYLQTYNGKDDKINDFENSFYDKVANPYPYVFSLWFNRAVLGVYGKKTKDEQLKLMERIIADAKAPGTLVAAANYQKELNLIFSAAFDKAPFYSEKVGSIRNWQFTGPFENLSESGIYKDYGPLQHPEPDAVFKSLSNANVKWFSPTVESPDGWTSFSYQFNRWPAVVYAQSFVTAPSDQSVYCNVGFSGAIKVWINDELVISEFKELTSELDHYTVKCDLKKGANRVLVQLSYTNSNYPNFALRFTDEKYKAIPDIKGSSTFAAYPKSAGQKKHAVIPHFAQKYFEDKISAQPDNPVNYLLLADVFMRSNQLLDARKVISTALDKATTNSLLRMKLLEILTKENNRTLLLEELEKIKQSDPESLVVFEVNLKQLFENEKYSDCAAELAKRKKIYGEDDVSAGYEILLLEKDKKYDEMMKVAENMYEKNPENAKLIAMMYTIKKDVNQDKKGAMKVFEKFMKDNYNYDVYINYANILIEQGDIKEGIALKEKLIQIFNYDPNGPYNLAKYYFGVKQYDQAEKLLEKSLALSPYNEVYWEFMGDIKSERKNTVDALKAYNRSLEFNPNQYDLLSKIRKTLGKPEISKLFPQIDIDKSITEDKPDEAKNTDYGYYYILDQQDAVVYPDGANEKYLTTIVKITNDDGVERYKEWAIGYNNSETLLIEKSEIVKPGKTKIQGERNGNEIVFTNLEVGDVVVIKYRLQSNASGRFAKEYWDKYYFGGQIYSAFSRYNLLVPSGLKIDYTFINSNLKPTISEVEDFKQYSWVTEKPTPMEDEPLMPLVGDAGPVLHITTLPSWQNIADWYSDVVNNKSEEDFEILALYKKLFPEGNHTLSEFQKAKIIYEYIEANIRYSSVSFRQSGLVPQRASATLTTRLGDCKDLSNLFVTLAHMAGINAQMVLVNTRDNGQNDILLPSVEFNHCIAKAVLDKKSYYIELTDNYLPFASLPNTLNGATALEIPSKSVNEKAVLIKLKAGNRTRDIIKRKIDIQPRENDLELQVTIIMNGAFSSGVRSDYRNLENEKQKQELEKVLARNYKNNVRLEKVTFTDLDKLNDSVEYSYKYRVKNEIAEIGSMKTFKIVYPDIIASLDYFSADERKYPIEYWNYENADEYETSVNVTAPDGSKFVELPKSETITFHDMKYIIQYTLKAPGKLTITRKFTNNRVQQILPVDYDAFKNFFEKIVKAEQKFIAYKP